MATDFFTADTLTLKGLCTSSSNFANGGAGSRGDRSSARTLGHLTDENVSADLDDESVQIAFLLRSRDTRYVSSFDTVSTAPVLRTRIRTPNANAHAERFVRTIRTECLEQLPILNALHLERVLRTCRRHSNDHRPDHGISQETPGAGSATRLPAPPPSVGDADQPIPNRRRRIHRHDRLGGMARIDFRTLGETSHANAATRELSITIS